MSRGEADSRDWEDIKKGGWVNSLGILARTLRAVYLILVARLFGSETLGNFLLVWSFVDVVSKLGLFGLDRGVMKFVPSLNGGSRALRAARMKIIFGLSLVCSLLVSVVLFALSGPVARDLLSQPHLVTGFQILSWAVLPISLRTILLAVTRLERRMESEVLVGSLLEPVLLLTFAGLLASMGWRETGLYLAQLLAVIGAALAAAGVVVRRGLLKAEGDCPSLTPTTTFQVFRFSLPIAAYDLLAMGIMRLDLFLLAPFVTPAQLGIYGAATQVAALAKKIRQSFEPVYMPVLSDQLRKEQREAVAENLERVMYWISVFSFGFLIVLAGAGDGLLRLFGPEFSAGYNVLLLLAWGYAVNGFWGITENVILLVRPYWNLCNWLIALGLIYLSCSAWIPVYGMLGAAGAVALVFTILNLMRLIQACILVGRIPLTVRELWVACLGGTSVVILILISAWVPGGWWLRALATVLLTGIYTVTLRHLRHHAWRTP